jgi:hypothetical protein
MTPLYWRQLYVVPIVAVALPLALILRWDRAFELAVVPVWRAIAAGLVDHVLAPLWHAACYIDAATVGRVHAMLTEAGLVHVVDHAGLMMLATFIAAVAAAAVLNAPLPALRVIARATWHIAAGCALTLFAASAGKALYIGGFERYSAVPYTAAVIANFWVYWHLRPLDDNFSMRIAKSLAAAGLLATHIIAAASHLIPSNEGMGQFVLLFAIATVFDFAFRASPTGRDSCSAAATAPSVDTKRQRAAAALA